MAMDNENPRTPNTETQTSKRLRVAKWVTAGALGFAAFASIGHRQATIPGQPRPNNPGMPGNPSHEPKRIIIDDSNMGRAPADSHEPGGQIIIDDSNMGRAPANNPQDKLTP